MEYFFILYGAGMFLIGYYLGERRAQTYMEVLLAYLRRLEKQNLPLDKE